MKNALEVLSRTAQDGYIKVLYANLTADTYTVIKDDTERLFGGHFDTLSGYMASFVAAGLIHQDDVTDFCTYTSPAFLRQFFREHHGKHIHWLNYRRKTSRGFHWVVLEVQSAEDYSEEHAAVYIVVKDVQASVEGQTSNIGGVLRALCDNYDSIYCLDLERGHLVSYRAFSHNIPAFEAFLHSDPDYRDLISRYISMSVFPEDRGHAARIMDLEFIRSYLKDHSSYSGEFRTVYDGEIHWYRIHYSRVYPEDALRYVAIGLSDISDEKRIEVDFYRNTKAILIVSADDANRGALFAILGENYPTLAATSAEDALQVLEGKHENIAVVLTDFDLPDSSCGQFLRQMKTDHRFHSIPVIVTDDGRERGEEIIRMGAADFVARPYQPEVVLHRVNFMVRFRESANMLNMLERDPLTDLCTREFFFRSAERIIRENPGEHYGMLLSDVEHFHFFKERYGLPKGDELLKHIAMLIPDLLSGFVIGGRISEDVFAFLIRNPEAVSGDVALIQRNLAALSQKLARASISVKYGLYKVDEDIPASAMCDRAVLAVKSIKGVYGTNLAEYDTTLREQLLKTQQILENAESGLSNEQFLVYYQPKHDIQHGCVGGAEAVIRWLHPIMGFMNPVSFVPLFEKNGFIEVLDKFVLRRVCRDIVEWQERGEPVVPISVNISRVDFDKSNLADTVLRIVDSFGIDHSLIHLEITESGYAEDPDGITREINKLHDAGFVIELDDFGTGYSSLAALSALPVDILKLDMSLLRQDNPVTNRNILEFSMKLAKIMKMEVLQEGVETQEELERVSSLGCDHVQGFYFSKPLAKEKFVEYCRRFHQVQSDNRIPCPSGKM